MRPLFELLLRLYPRSFRARFGSEMSDQAGRECRRAFGRGFGAGLLCVAQTCVDLAVGGVAERWKPTWTGEPSGIHAGRGVGMMMKEWWQDLGHAARALRRSPGFTAATAGTLALALGANAGIFSVVDAVLLDPLPFDDTDRLVHIAASAPGSDFPDEFGVSAEFFLQYRDRAEGLEDLAVFNSSTATVRAGDRVERLRVAFTSMSFFRTLGVSPALGRVPGEGEAQRVALISHALWTTWFGSDPGVIGRTYDFVGQPREVIGVMPPDFRFPRDDVVAWVPAEVGVGDVTPARFGMGLVGRMSPGTDHASLARELSTLASRLPELYGGPPGYARLIEQHVPVVRSLEEFVVGPVSGALWLLMGSVAVVLLIACANVANLFVVRSQGRGRDLAVRRAIGAGRGRLVRLQVAEAVVVAALAGAAALLLAWLVLPPFLAVVPGGVPGIGDARVSASTLVFTVVASALAALLCGLGPAVGASAPDLARLRDGGRGSTGGRRWGRHGLVVVQTALTLVLLVASGLLLRSFQELRHRDPGYDTEDILTFQFAPEAAHLTDGPSWARFHLDFLDRLRALPGVEAAGIVENVPLDEGTTGVGFLTGESASDDAAAAPRGTITFAGGDYFAAMGIRVLRGRGFVEEDVEVPGRVVVSRAAADLLWPGENPVGRRLGSSLFPEWHTVVGVVEDVLQDDLREEPEPLVYYPLVGPTPEAWALTSPGYVVRGEDAGLLAPEIRALIRQVAPSAPMYRVHTMEELAARATAQLSFTMLTLAVAAVLALVLGAIGLYGVLSHVVGERTREIGVRMALGAEAGRVRRMVVGQGARVVGLGVLLGLGASLLATRLLSSLLYGVAPVDAGTFAGMSLVLGAVGLLASYMPARRASRVDPVESLRA